MNSESAQNKKKNAIKDFTTIIILGIGSGFSNLYRIQKLLK